jgi:signal transduction histidine kinase
MPSGAPMERRESESARGAGGGASGPPSARDRPTEAPSGGPEEALRSLEAENRRLEAAHRLRDEVLASTAHEVRTHLNAVLGFGQLMQDGLGIPPLPPEQREYLVDLLQSAHSLGRLIGDVLDIARLEAGRMEVVPEEVDLASAVKEVATILRGQATKKRIAVSIVPGADPATAHVDRAKLLQVLYTFVWQGIRSTPEGGRLTVMIRPRNEGRFSVEVTDGGPPIAPEDLAHVFSEFHVDRRRRGDPDGSAMAFALAKRLVEAQGGTVAVETTPQGNTLQAIYPREVRKSTKE